MVDKAAAPANIPNPASRDYQPVSSFESAMLEMEDAPI